MFEPQVEPAAADAPSVPRGTGPLWQAKEMLCVARLDVEAIGRVSRDSAALPYAILVKVLSTAVRAGLGLSLTTLSPAGALGAVAATTAVAVVVDAVGLLVLHGAAKVVFGATGSFIGLIRVLWLGSVIGLLAIIPVVGGLVAGIWGLLMMMVTFQEVDGIERLQALGLSLGVSAVVYVVLSALS